MKTLLPIDSPKYLRRLVRELNREAMTGNGFYASIRTLIGISEVRCSAAKFHDGRIVVKPYGKEQFYDVANECFADVYGRSIRASRS